MSTLINRHPTRLAPSLHLVKPTKYLFLLLLNKLEVLPLRHEEANFATSKNKEGLFVYHGLKSQAGEWISGEVQFSCSAICPEPCFLPLLCSHHCLHPLVDISHVRGGLQLPLSC